MSIKQLKVVASTLDWKPIGQKNWQGEYTYWCAKIPNSGYGTAEFVIATEGAIGAPFDKAYIDKLSTGKVQLHVQYKNRNLTWKWLKASVPMDRVKLHAEEFAKQFMIEKSSAGLPGLGTPMSKRPKPMKFGKSHWD